MICSRDIKRAQPRPCCCVPHVHHCVRCPCFGREHVGNDGLDYRCVFVQQRFSNRTADHEPAVTSPGARSRCYRFRRRSATSARTAHPDARCPVQILHRSVFLMSVFLTSVFPMSSDGCAARFLSSAVGALGARAPRLQLCMHPLALSPAAGNHEYCAVLMAS